MSRGFIGVTATVARPGLRLPLPADRAPGRSSPSTPRAGHGLGRLLAALVRALMRQPGAARCRPGSRCASRLLSATLAPVLGTMAGVVLARFAPLPRPHLLRRHDLRAAGHAGGDPRPVAAAAVRRAWTSPRGFWTIVIAHTTFSHVLCHRGRAVAAGDLRPQPRGGGDGSGRPAAQDLLRRHPADHRAGAGRRLAAGLHAVARRPGDRQLHLRPGRHDPADADLPRSASA